MSQDERRAQLKQAAAKYFEGLAKKDFNLIPYDDDVSLRTPITPGRIHKPLVGKENLRTVWWTPLPAIPGDVRVFDFYYTDDLAAVARDEGEMLLGVLNGDGFLEAVLQRDLHPDGDRGDVVKDVAEIGFGIH